VANSSAPRERTTRVRRAVTSTTFTAAFTASRSTNRAARFRVARDVDSSAPRSRAARWFRGIVQFSDGVREAARFRFNSPSIARMERRRILGWPARAARWFQRFVQFSDGVRCASHHSAHNRRERVWHYVVSTYAPSK
jgi:hypothetical protein